MAAITLKQLHKRFGRTHVIRGIDLQIADGEFVVFVGPSGCGKSTVLRMIAGLEEVSDGDIHIGATRVNDLDPKARNIAMVFQNYAIYPHMSVRQNIAIGLYTAKVDKETKNARVEETAEILGLAPYLDRRPAALSGGQRQRVAIGRAMVRDPAVFLFDEPLSNLDAQLRAQMRIEIKKLHQRLGTTIIYVTHDQTEAMTMADRIVVMKAGEILQAGAPMALYDAPADVFTARFIGSPSMNIVRGRAVDGSYALDREGDILLGLRPQDLRVGESEGLRIAGVVRAVEPLGPETYVHMDVDGETVIASAPGHHIPEVGSHIVATLAAERLHRFDPETELRMDTH
ncbi:MAG: sn-glycerol-3-phosphate ABC transporter ATP-binding protein UgpC [Cardiobacteriaceae bacterium]|nr:sn-glycerol-3-phosphate ABC transporter ATP-binding protein UgpC [Cardiobacteriaceae bacterium]